MKYKSDADKFLLALATDPEREAGRIARGEHCGICDTIGCVPLRHSIAEKPLSDAHALAFARRLLAQPGGESTRTLMLARYIDARNKPNRPPGTAQCCALAVQVHAHGNSCVLETGHDGDHQNWQGVKFTRSVEYAGELEGAIAKLCRCEKHKRYRAARKPTGGCEGCWRLWILTHPSIDLETRWRR